MPIAIVSPKGQITLPISFRKRLGMKPHDRVNIELNGDAIVVKRVADFFELEGFLGKALPEAEEQKRMLRMASRRVRVKVR
ncbi:MAG TPA: AbrB/MazE/SpoVT family DNA-binding domain-containing protein [Candidatus Hydrogenedentes bacterium]|nr:AbrB/MazE/SpoVT family DNA-binding domain-containing protein [Candidatus Hydrogenedentota bacterium]